MHCTTHWGNCEPQSHICKRRKNAPLLRRMIARRPWHDACTFATTGGLMLDLVFVLVVVGFFALATASTHACERL